MNREIEQSLQSLLAIAKGRGGSVTLEEVNDSLPAGVPNPDDMEDLLEALAQRNIPVLDEAEEEAQAPVAAAAPTRSRDKERGSRREKGSTVQIQRDDDEDEDDDEDLGGDDEEEAR